MTRVVIQAAMLGCVSVLALGCGVADPSLDEVESVGDVQSALTSSETRFFVPLPDPGAVKQVAALLKSRDLLNAARLTAMVTTPQGFGSRAVRRPKSRSPSRRR